MKTSLRQVDADFADVVTYLQKRGLIPPHPSSVFLVQLRQFHRSLYSLAWWRFHLPSKAAHRRVFVQEIASDAFQILPQSLMGYNKTTLLLVRSVIENVLRHVYYYDHEVEFEKLNEEADWYFAVRDLFPYVLGHPKFRDYEKKYDAICRLKNLYHELSAHVHGMKAIHLEMRAGLRSIVPDQATMQEHAALLKRCAEAANFLLVVFHRKVFQPKPDEETAPVMSVIPSKARRVIAGIR